MNYKHGDVVNNHIPRLYRIWGLMKTRCNCPNNPAYINYGGRGIKVCDEWNNYVSFKKWALSNGYKENLTIDRINVNGNYCPENCRWIPLSAQAGNTRSNTYYTIDGVTHYINEWSRIYGIKAATIIRRIQAGWDPERAITTHLLRHPNRDYSNNGRPKKNSTILIDA